MGDMADVFNEWNKQKQEKRASNRAASAELLSNQGIQYTTKNGGAHLIVEGKDCFIDFWPGTGRWITRTGTKGFGVRNLVNLIKGAA